MQYFEDGNVKPIMATIGQEAMVEYVRIYDSYVDIQNGDFENEYMKSMYPKQKNYLPRFALLIHAFTCYFDAGDYTVISKESMLKAERLSKYFIAHAKKIKINTETTADIKKTILAAKNDSKKEQFKKLYTLDRNINIQEVAELLGVSKSVLHRYRREVNHESEPK